jgi:hypothetical protein
MAAPEIPAYGLDAAKTAELQKLVYATQVNAAATLAAALITASGKPHTVNQSLKIMKDIQYSLWAQNGHGVYEQWKKTADLDTLI